MKAVLITLRYHYTTFKGNRKQPAEFLSFSKIAPQLVIFICSPFGIPLLDSASMISCYPLEHYRNRSIIIIIIIIYHS